MTLREQIIGYPETLSDLAFAAETRYRDAEQLLEGGRWSGATYLLGIAAEMWLKTACFRARRIAVATPMHGLLNPARVWMLAQAPSISHEGYHSLLFWSEYLIRWRAVHHFPISRTLAGDLRHHVASRLFSDWKIDLRYSNVGVRESHAWRVYNDASWLRSNWKMLWR